MASATSYSVCSCFISGYGVQGHETEVRGHKSSGPDIGTLAATEYQLLSLRAQGVKLVTDLIDAFIGPSVRLPSACLLPCTPCRSPYAALLHSGVHSGYTKRPMR